MLGAAFGMAFVLGPPLGGAAADRDARLPFAISFFESVLLFGTLQLLPESKGVAKHAKTEDSSSATSSDSEKAKDDGLAQNGDVKEEGKGERQAGGKGKISVFRGPGGKQMGWGFHDRFCVVLAEGLYHTAFAPFLTKVSHFFFIISEYFFFVFGTTTVPSFFFFGREAHNSSKHRQSHTRTAVSFRCFSENKINALLYVHGAKNVFVFGGATSVSVETFVRSRRG